MFDFGRILSGIVSPKMALSLLHSKIVSTIGHEIDRYKMQMNTVTNEIIFDIEYPERLGERPDNYKATGRHKYKLDDGADLIKTFSHIASTKLEKGVTIDFIFMDYDDNGKIEVIIAYRNGELKQRKTIEL